MITESDKSQLRFDLEVILDLLQNIEPERWATTFVDSKMWFHRKWCGEFVFSTMHGADFFKNVKDCLYGKTWEPDNKGEYEQNFRNFIKQYRRAK